jgi:hypothetical protein
MTCHVLKMLLKFAVSKLNCNRCLKTKAKRNTSWQTRLKHSCHLAADRLSTCTSLGALSHGIRFSFLDFWTNYGGRHWHSEHAWRGILRNRGNLTNIHVRALKHKFRRFTRRYAEADTRNYSPRHRTRCTKRKNRREHEKAAFTCCWVGWDETSRVSCVGAVPFTHGRGYTVQ